MIYQTCLRKRGQINGISATASLPHPPNTIYRAVTHTSECFSKVGTEQHKHHGAEHGSQAAAAEHYGEHEQAHLGGDDAHGAAVDQTHAQGVREDDEEQNDGEGGHGEGGHQVHSPRWSRPALEQV